MGFYDEAVHVLETIARALNGAFSYGSMADFYNRSPEKTPDLPGIFQNGGADEKAYPSACPGRA